MFSDISHLFLNTQPMNRTKAAEAMRAFYRFCKKPEPEIVFVNGPTELKEKFDPDDLGHSFFDYQTIAHFVTRRGTNKQLRLSSLVRQLFRDYWKMKGDGHYLGSSIVLMPEDYEYGEEDEWSKLATPLWDESFVTVNCQKKSYIMERPRIALTNDRGFHCADGPAIVFRDGTEIYCWEAEQFTREQLLHPETMTLKEIHHHSNKHIAIDLVGVEHYLELAKAWKPDVKGKFKKFFRFAEMEKDQSEFKYHEDRPYIADISHGSVNGQRKMILKYRDFNDMYILPIWEDISTYEESSLLFDPEDFDLWDVLNVDQMIWHRCFHIELGYQKGRFWLTEQKLPGWNYPNCIRNIVPDWFRAKMLRNQDAVYETDKYRITLKDGELNGEGDVKIHENIMHGNENVPDYFFDLDLESNTWEGLLEKWAQLSFEWLGMSS
jgi:hypothetical protein